MTRPKHQSAGFIQMLEQAGGQVLAFPSIEISQIELTEALKCCLTSLNKMDLLIFISANAVEHFVRGLKALALSPSLISSKIATIGKATRLKAEAYGLNVSVSPVQGFNSEALLAMQGFQQAQLQGKKCLIIRGLGGLAKLGDELHNRGAKVFYAELYQRAIPSVDGNISRQALSQHWLDWGISGITCTSNESLQNLYDMLEPPGRHAMLNTQLLVASNRARKLAQSLGFKSVRVAKSAANQHMFEALVNG